MIEPRIFNSGSGAFACKDTKRIFLIGGAEKDDGGESFKVEYGENDPKSVKIGEWENINSYA